MSLEDQLAKLTAATEKQNDLLEKLLSANTGAKPAAPKADKPAAAAKAEKPAAEKPAEADKPAATDGEAVTVETLDAKFRPWLAEFPKGHPENDARKAKFKEILGKLDETKMSAITDESKLVKLDKWFEGKARTWDEGHGIGRFAQSPDEVDVAGEDDGDL